MRPIPTCRRERSGRGHRLLHRSPWLLPVRRRSYYDMRIHFITSSALLTTSLHHVRHSSLIFRRAMVRHDKCSYIDSLDSLLLLPLRPPVCRTLATGSTQNEKLTLCTLRICSLMHLASDIDACFLTPQLLFFLGQVVQIAKLIICDG